jgi:CubicO group peptidase (beta-lactamase class C family)
VCPEPVLGNDIEYSTPNLLVMTLCLKRLNLLNATRWCMGGQMIEHLFSLVGGHQDRITLPTTGKLQLAGYGGGFHVSPRDLARLGVLLLADGVWRGT